MGLSAKLWDRYIDRVLLVNTGHKFGPPRPWCQNGCGADCVTILEDFKKGVITRCPNEQKSKQPEETSANPQTEERAPQPDFVVRSSSQC